MAPFEIVVARGHEDLDDAARIWAEATAARDGDPQVAPLEVARPLIEAVVSGSTESLLLIARAAHGEALGFAASGPVGAGHERRAELRYLGVRPDAWGGGVARQLLHAIAEQLRGLGFVEAELWVNQDNPRAIALYRLAGWQRAPEIRVNPRSGRLMERYYLWIGGTAARLSP
jgi:ribosomal protein S18 acetylase RimI-like enzyme